MQFSFKKFLVAASFLIAVMLTVAFSSTRNTNAQSPSPSLSDCPAGTPLYGWAWASPWVTGTVASGTSTIGWISFNSDNPTGHGGRHCVSKDSSGNLNGWAWSSNIGWIKFGGLSGFPASGSALGNAKITGSAVTGWARACAGTVKAGDSTTLPKLKGDCSTMTSRPDGWDGWIELTGVNHSVDYDTATGAITGHAWGSDVVGWVNFNLTSTVPVAVAASCSFDTPVQMSASTHQLSWRSSGVDRCTATNFIGGKVSGSEIVTTPISDRTYSLTCTPTIPTPGVADPTCSTMITGAGSVTPGCPGGPGCPTEVVDPGGLNVQMWLDNDKSKGSTRIKLGQDAKINWQINTTDPITLCTLRFDGVLEGTTPTDSRGNDNPYIKSGLALGRHVFKMSCSSSSTSYTGKFINALGTSLDYLIVNVVDPSNQEI